MDRLTDWHPYIETLTETLKRDRETDTHTHTHTQTDEQSYVQKDVRIEMQERQRFAETKVQIDKLTD